MRYQTKPVHQGGHGRRRRGAGHIWMAVRAAVAVSSAFIVACAAVQPQVAPPPERGAEAGERSVPSDTPPEKSVSAGAALQHPISPPSPAKTPPPAEGESQAAGAGRGGEGSPAGIPAVEGTATPAGAPAPKAQSTEEIARKLETLWEELGLDFVNIPGGEFVMGVKKTAHPEMVKDFLLSKHEVTVAQFRKFVEATGHRTTPESGVSCRRNAGAYWDTLGGGSWRHLGFPQTDNHPVVCVSWFDARAFCEWAGVRLPTAAEWEYAGGNGSRHTTFSWGDGPPVGRLGGNLADESAKRRFNWWWAAINDLAGYDDGWAYTAPVGSYLPNDFGLYDMTGNVTEWCSDSRMLAPLKSPDPNAGIYMRLIKGGSWNLQLGSAWLSNDEAYFPYNSSDFIGFRVARNAPRGGDAPAAKGPP